MPLSRAAASAALHALVLTSVLVPPAGAAGVLDGPGSPASGAIPIIARPESSDLYVPVKTNTPASTILRHNADLIRSHRPDAPYQLSRAAALGWWILRDSDLPAMRGWEAVSTTPLPEPSGFLAVGLAPFLVLLCRRQAMRLTAPRTNLARSPRSRDGRV